MLKQLLAGLLVLALCAACGAQPSEPAVSEAPPAASAVAPVPEPAPEPEPEPEPDPVRELLDSLTVEQKIAQLFFVRCPETGGAELAASERCPGGFLLFGADFADRTAEQAKDRIASFQSAARVPLLIGVDEEGGTVVRVSRYFRETRFQSPRALYEAGGLDALTADAAEKDAFLQGFGVNVNLAPVADLSGDPNDFIYPRTFGQDAAATSDYVSAVTAQMAADGMGSVLKHFPGYGDNADTHTGIAVDERPYEDFVNSDFLPFSAGFQSGGAMTAVLVSHNIVECMDGELPASLSPNVHRVLREELGFDGVVMTDDLAMEAVSAYAGDGAVAVMALEAGNDLVLTTDYRTQIPKVIEAVENGDLAESVIDAACRRVLRWKQALGLLEGLV